MGREESYKYKMDYYVYGNTVRPLEAEPVKMPRRQLEREQEQRRRENRTAVRRQQKALRLGMGYVFFCAVAVFLTVGICVQYICVQTAISSRLKNISDLETEVMNLRAENDSAMKSIELTTDLDAVKEKAITQLGMQYASGGQIVYYSVEDSDYMNQYADIPEN
ncbi:MAG: hypothetical protein J6A75_12775 [Lachnospiraceae bacterium]|nr:hypothetical protein [Lachnospiraceae bacterium]